MELSTKPSGAQTGLVKEALPQSFNVKYLGQREAKGLWGIKHTRRPVDAMVTQAKSAGTLLPQMKLIVSSEGCSLISSSGTEMYRIDCISYGVQDLVYTRVFSMIIVCDMADNKNPFQCHAFVCESRQTARRLTYCLATAFQDYSRRVRHTAVPSTTKFAIDLRSPQEIEADMRHPDSEA